jgi:hypothetical protein
MNPPKSEPPRLPFVSFLGGQRRKIYAFTAKKLGAISALQRPMPTVDKTSQGFAKQS